MGNFFKDVEKAFKGKDGWKTGALAAFDPAASGVTAISGAGIERLLGKKGPFTKNIGNLGMGYFPGEGPQPAAPAGMRDTLASIPTKHYSNKKWYRKYRNWAGSWREIAKGSLGLGGYEAMDPLSRLQGELGGNVSEEDFINALTEDYDFTKDISARDVGLNKYLRQQAAQMGVENAYAGVGGVAQRARSTLADTSLAAYRPQAYQTQQQLQDQTQQLLTSIAQAEFESDKAIAEAGRSA